METLDVDSSFGIALPRHCTCVQHPEVHYVFDVPIGMPGKCIPRRGLL